MNRLMSGSSSDGDEKERMFDDDYSLKLKLFLYVETLIASLTVGLNF